MSIVNRNRTQTADRLFEGPGDRDSERSLPANFRAPTEYAPTEFRAPGEWRAPTGSAQPTTAGASTGAAPDMASAQSRLELFRGQY